MSPVLQMFCAIREGPGVQQSIAMGTAPTGAVLLQVIIEAGMCSDQHENSSCWMSNLYFLLEKFPTEII